MLIPLGNVTHEANRMGDEMDLVESKSRLKIKGMTVLLQRRKQHSIAGVAESATSVGLNEMESLLDELSRFHMLYGLFESCQNCRGPWFLHIMKLEDGLQRRIHSCGASVSNT